MKPSSENDILLEVREITKDFPGVKALDKLDFTLKKGEIHAIVGENGAGKSTLMKILSGVIPRTSGEIIIDGEHIENNSVEIAQKFGIRMIYQELENVPKISVAENIFLGRLPSSKVHGFVNLKGLYREVESLFKNFSININPKTALSNLSVAEQQFVEILKAISYENAKIIIMDEPTSSLTDVETKKLFSIIRELKKKAISVIYISHRLDEVIEISDRISVFRDGKNRGTSSKEDFSKADIVSLMLGHLLDEINTDRNYVSKEVILKVENLSVENKILNFEMELHKGEIMGIAGLMGSGKDELVKGLFGLWPTLSKKIEFKHKKVKINNPRDALNLGIVYLPEERKTQSLFLPMSVGENISTIWLHEINRSFFLKKGNEKELANEYIEKLAIKTPSVNQQIINLSGGNQQKAIFSRILALEPAVMILNDPTRGVDIGSKEEIYHLIRILAEEGTSFIILSSEIPEICNLADSVIVLSKGEIRGKFFSSEVNTKNVLVCASRLD